MIKYKCMSVKEKVVFYDIRQYKKWYDVPYYSSIPFVSSDIGLEQYIIVPDNLYKINSLEDIISICPSGYNFDSDTIIKKGYSGLILDYKNPMYAWTYQTYQGYISCLDTIVYVCVDGKLKPPEFEIEIHKSFQSIEYAGFTINLLYNIGKHYLAWQNILRNPEYIRIENILKEMENKDIALQYAVFTLCGELKLLPFETNFTDEYVELTYEECEIVKNAYMHGFHYIHKYDISDIKNIFFKMKKSDEINQFMKYLYVYITI